MKLQPVRSSVKPAYPTREMVDADGDLLRQVPKRWQTNAVVLTALAGLGLVVAPRVLSGAPTKIESPVVARVAPLFPQKVIDRVPIAGKIAMPKFLTEEEARQIIMDEAGKAGITFTPELQVISNVPFTTQKTDANGNQSTEVTRQSVTLDGADTKRHIAYEFISNEDVSSWAQQGITPCCGESPAEMFRDGLTQGIPAGSYAVLYDPALSPFTGEDLRQQVRDFITWLKTQGVI